MKDKRGLKKLVLNRETLRNLTDDQLKSAAGGHVMTDGCGNSLDCTDLWCSAQCLTQDCATKNCGTLACPTIGCPSTPAQTCGVSCGCATSACDTLGC